ncbi:MAG TPA: hypothetical protein VN648_22820 [Candidatus Methylomirabilis sp.]|nr:hypothetical protein [Candidatus Methylomirabilis sp.]
MPVTHVIRYRDMYYLHVGRTKTGKPRYWFSTKAEGDLVESIPEGYEIYENPDAQVFLRKIVPQLVTPAEVTVVEEGLKRFAPKQNCLVDVQGKQIVVYHAERGNMYQKMLRFTLDDKKDRTFRVQRWCFKGSIDDWIDLWVSGGIGKLPDLVREFCPHIGQDSFYELM